MCGTALCIFTVTGFVQMDQAFASSRLPACKRVCHARALTELL